MRRNVSGCCHAQRRNAVIDRRVGSDASTDYTLEQIQAIFHTCKNSQCLNQTSGCHSGSTSTSTGNLHHGLWEATAHANNALSPKKRHNPGPLDYMNTLKEAKRHRMTYSCKAPLGFQTVLPSETILLRGTCANACTIVNNGRRTDTPMP